MAFIAAPWLAGVAAAGFMKVTNRKKLNDVLDDLAVTDDERLAALDDADYFSQEKEQALQQVRELQEELGKATTKVEQLETRAAQTEAEKQQTAQKVAAKLSDISAKHEAERAQLIKEKDTFVNQANQKEQASLSKLAGSGDVMAGKLKEANEKIEQLKVDLSDAIAQKNIAKSALHSTLQANEQRDHEERERANQEREKKEQAEEEAAMQQAVSAAAAAAERAAKAQEDDEKAAAAAKASADPKAALQAKVQAELMTIKQHLQNNQLPPHEREALFQKLQQLMGVMQQLMTAPDPAANAMGMHGGMGGAAPMSPAMNSMNGGMGNGMMGASPMGGMPNQMMGGTTPQPPVIMGGIVSAGQGMMLQPGMNGESPYGGNGSMSMQPQQQQMYVDQQQVQQQQVQQQRQMSQDQQRVSMDQQQWHAMSMGGMNNGGGSYYPPETPVVEEVVQEKKAIRSRRMSVSGSGLVSPGQVPVSTPAAPPRMASIDKGERRVSIDGVKRTSIDGSVSRGSAVASAGNRNSLDRGKRNSIDKGNRNSMDRGKRASVDGKKKFGRTVKAASWGDEFGPPPGKCPMCKVENIVKGETICKICTAGK